MTLFSPQTFVPTTKQKKATLWSCMLTSTIPSDSEPALAFSMVTMPSDSEPALAFSMVTIPLDSEPALAFSMVGNHSREPNNKHAHRQCSETQTQTHTDGCSASNARRRAKHSRDTQNVFPTQFSLMVPRQTYECRVAVIPCHLGWCILLSSVIKPTMSVLA